MSGRLPDFLVVGAMKAGTTSLHHYLDAHPDLFLPRTKELNFFRDERSFSRGTAWYAQQFAGAREDQVCGEVSPDYTKHPHHQGAPARIASVVPDVRLVYLVRHPVERIQSMYLHQVVAGREDRPIDVAVVEDPEYLWVSRYAMQLEQHLEHVPRERVLVCASEELAEDRGAVMARIHRFVGVEARPESATAVTEEWYRGSGRRRRGRLARVLAEHDVARRAFQALPGPVRDRARRLGSSEVDDTAARRLSERTRAELAERLRPDLVRFADIAPEVVARWGLLD